MSVCDCAIVGGGAIGLSIAYELAVRGKSVTLIERVEPGKETSWAGAGILPPAPKQSALDPLDQLRQLAMSLHPIWATKLLQETGIETGFRRCGGMYVALTPGEKAALIGLRQLCIEQEIESHLLTPQQAHEKEPGLAVNLVSAGLELPGECQIRNPRHLRALVEACSRRGVLIHSNQEITSIETADNGTWRIGTPTEGWCAKTICVAAGAWSQQLLASLGVEFSVFPMRGQIVLYRCDQRPLQRILNIGPRYLVPRDDGRVLVGSTEEEVGFDKRTTEEGILDLRSLAESLIPTLRHAEVERTWSGLRPASFDSLPYMGEAPARPGLFVACGHFRSGLSLSPAVGVVMADLICGDAPAIDLWPFRLSRG